MPPIPFKNLSNFNLTIEVEAIANESFNDKPYDIVTQNFVNCQANTQFFVNIQLKENMSFKGPRPAKDYIRKILVLKIKGSSIYYNYPMEILVFEGNNNSGINWWYELEIYCELICHNQQISLLFSINYWLMNIRWTLIGYLLLIIL